MDYFHSELGIIGASQSFTLNDIQYPSDWLRQASPEVKASMGFTDVTIEPRPSDKFYFVEEVRAAGKISYNKIEKDVDMIKKMMIGEVTNVKSSMLSSTDWEVIAELDTSRAVARKMSDATKVYRQAVRDAHTAAIAAIESATTVAELEALVAPAWPVDTTVAPAV